jgi:hypothetical protein
MTARVVRHRRGAISIEPVDADLEDKAVDTVVRVFDGGVVAITRAELEEARSRHPSAWQPTPKGTAA